MASKRKYKPLSLSEKRRLIQLVENDPRRKKDIAAEFGITTSTLTYILKNKEAILNGTEEMNEYMHKRPNVNYGDIEGCLTEWLKYAKDKNIAITDMVLRDMAEHFAKEIGRYDFRADNAWIDRFKIQHGISTKCEDIPPQAGKEFECEKWKKEMLPQLLKDYHPNDIFNVEETSLLFKPHTEEQNEKEKNKDYASIMMCANSTGMEKLKLLVVGESKEPKGLKEVQSLVFYDSNKHLMISNSIFENWVFFIDRKFLVAKRQILLIVANSSERSKVVIKDLVAVKIVFLPSYLSDKLMPMNLGIIAKIKENYEKRRILKQMMKMERQGEDVTLVDCIRELVNSWEEITPELITGCFRKAGIFKEKHEPEDLKMKLNDVKEEVQLSENEWNTFKEYTHFDPSFEEMLNVDGYPKEHHHHHMSKMMRDHSQNMIMKKPNLNLNKNDCTNTLAMHAGWPREAMHWKQ